MYQNIFFTYLHTTIKLNYYKSMSQINLKSHPCFPRPKFFYDRGALLITCVSGLSRVSEVSDVSRGELREVNLFLWIGELCSVVLKSETQILYTMRNLLIINGLRQGAGPNLLIINVLHQGAGPNRLTINGLWFLKLFIDSQRVKPGGRS